MKNTILVKNMVCHRCILAIENILEELNILKVKVSLGHIILFEEINTEKYDRLITSIEKIGFAILSSKEEVIVENVKKISRELINSKQSKFKNLSTVIEKELSINYAKISKLFSSTEGKTIEKYIIELRIEKVKELIWYNELSISEISYELEYSTPQHLSKQFKQITGMTTSEYKKLGQRKELDKI